MPEYAASRSCSFSTRSSSSFCRISRHRFYPCSSSWRDYQSFNIVEPGIFDAVDDAHVFFLGGLAVLEELGDFGVDPPLLLRTHPGLLCALRVRLHRVIEGLVGREVPGLYAADLVLLGKIFQLHARIGGVDLPQPHLLVRNDVAERVEHFSSHLVRELRGQLSLGRTVVLHAPQRISQCRSIYLNKLHTSPGRRGRLSAPACPAPGRTSVLHRTEPTRTRGPVRARRFA